MCSLRAALSRLGFLALLCAVALVASACTSNTELVDSTTSAGQIEPTPVPSVAAEEPTAAPAETATEPAAATPAEPTPVPTPTEPPPTFRSDALMGLSPDAAYGYGGTTSAWNTPTSCDAEPIDALAGLNIDASTTEAPQIFSAGLSQAGDVREMRFFDASRAAVLSSCEQGDGFSVWLQFVDLDDGGRIGALGPVVVLDSTDGRFPWLGDWQNRNTIAVRTSVETDPDDYDSWFIEQQDIDLTSGDIVATQQIELADGGPRYDRPTVISPDGQFLYREIEDPGGAVGCEGFGVAASIEVDDGSGPRSALGLDGPVYSGVFDLHFGPDGLIAWISGCEGFSSAHVGVITDDGTIIDAHTIDVYDIQAGQGVDATADYQHYRLNDDGFLVAIGFTWAEDGGGPISILRYDLSTDPYFVNSADPAPFIGEPLATALDGTSTWHAGEALDAAGDDPCTGSTLYGKTSTGFVRALDRTPAVDPVVKIVASEPREIIYDEVPSFTSRVMVLLTECESSYDGYRVWFGDEPQRVHHGLWLQQADLGDVADVLSVREEVEPGENFPRDIVAEVVLLDGTVTEVILVAIEP